MRKHNDYYIRYISVRVDKHDAVEFVKQYMDSNMDSRYMPLNTVNTTRGNLIKRIHQYGLWLYKETDYKSKITLSANERVGGLYFLPTVSGKRSTQMYCNGSLFVESWK